MKILITNDDSVHAQQLIPLIKACQRFAEVTVVVPKQEQSAKSHSIEIRQAFEINQRELAPGLTVWTVDSTPADCVRFAVSGLKETYDLVISGINRGYNLGRDTMYSGTLAAATEAVGKGMKAIAVSTSVKYYDQAVSHLEEILLYLEENKLLERCPLYNINIPVDPKGFRITQLGGLSFSEEFVPIGNDLFFPGGKPLKASGADPTVDTDACALGYISVTPLLVNRTDFGTFDALTQKKTVSV